MDEFHNLIDIMKLTHINKKLFKSSLSQ